MVLGLVFSLFAFGGNKGEVKTANAAEVVPEAGTSATFSDQYFINSFSAYQNNIVSIKISNRTADLPIESDRICDPIIIKGCTYTDVNGLTTKPEEGIIFAYLSKASGSTADNLRYDCVLYANTETIYANPHSYYMFGGFAACEEMNLKMLDTSKVTDMTFMFENCTSLVKLDISNFDTSNVTDMRFMFSGCSSLTELDLSSFNTSSVTSMYSMFEGCSSLAKLDVINFDTSNVTNMYRMFFECTSLTELDLSSFVTSNVQNMANMFTCCSSLKKINLTNFDTSNVKGHLSMMSMFAYCSSLTELDLSSFDTSNVECMDGMFGYCSSLTKIDLSSFNTSNVTGMSAMFAYCSSLTDLNLSNFDTSKATDMYGMFGGCNSLKTLDISNFEMSQCADIYYYDEDEGLEIDFFTECNNLEYVACPKSLPQSGVINLPSQFSTYSGITALTNENLTANKIIDLTIDKFIYNWKALRAEGGAEGICAALTAGTEGNTKLTQLLSEYDGFDDATKTTINAATDIDGITIGESIEYIKNVLNGSQDTKGEYGITETSEYFAFSIADNSFSVIIAIALIGVLSIFVYYFCYKKKTL